MLIKVRAKPDARKDSIVLLKNQTYEISVRALPIHGMANQAIREQLANYFNQPIEQVRLVKGAHSRNKTFEIFEQPSLF